MKKLLLLLLLCSGLLTIICNKTGDPLIHTGLTRQQVEGTWNTTLFISTDTLIPITLRYHPDSTYGIVIEGTFAKLGNMTIPLHTDSGTWNIAGDSIVMLRIECRNLNTQTLIPSFPLIPCVPQSASLPWRLTAQGLWRLYFSEVIVYLPDDLKSYPLPSGAIIDLTKN